MSAGHEYVVYSRSGMTESAIRNFGPPPEKSSEQIAAEMISRVQDEGFPTEAQFEDYKKRLFEGGNLNAPLGPIRIVERDGLHHLIDRNGRLALVMGPETYEQLKKEALS